MRSPGGAKDANTEMAVYAFPEHVGWEPRLSIELLVDLTPGKHLLAVKVLDRALMGGVWKPIKAACPKE